MDDFDELLYALSIFTWRENGARTGHQRVTYGCIEIKIEKRWTAIFLVFARGKMNERCW